jgi:hypothetical protein
MTDTDVYVKSLHYDSLYKLFPNKSGIARAKTNVYFSDAWRDLCEYAPSLARELDKTARLWQGLYNDQATAVLFLALALNSVTRHAADYALRLVLDAEGAKALSGLIKAIGAQACKYGALVVEAGVLQGRGYGNLDMGANIAPRVGDGPDPAWHVDQTKLAIAIRAILDEEVDTEHVRLYKSGEHWTSRWLWCVNGAHSKASEALLTGETVVPDTVPHAHRRAYAECLEHDPVPTWVGKSIFVPSVKYEHGKERAIYGGDSLTYMAFDRLIRPVEKAWRGLRVVLNPGYNGTIGMVKRIKAIQATGGLNVMMDYDDFNSAHSLDSMATVIRETCRKVNYDPDLTDELVKSVYNSYILHDGVCQKVTSSLMSGHRLTTYINSVLNRAYLLVAAPTLSECKSIHVGDDVYVSAKGMGVAARLMSEVRSSGLAMNPAKQSIGYVCSEFLRVATGRLAAYGYFCRALASVVSGNWTTQTPPSAAERLQSMVSSSWTLCNRSGSTFVSRLLISALTRWTAVTRGRALGLLEGSIALGNGPARHDFRMPMRYDIVERSKADSKGARPWASLPRYATNSYLSNHVSEIEMLAINAVHSSPDQAMVDSSYTKSYAGTEAVESRVKIKRVPLFLQRSLVGSEDVGVLLHSKDAKGVFTQYPLLMMLRNIIPRRVCLDILSRLGIDAEIDVEAQCWGGEARGVIAGSTLPYSDIVSLARRTKRSALHYVVPIWA